MVPHSASTMPTHSPISIEFEHSDWLVINKPPGIGMHSDNDQPGLMVQLEQQLMQPLWPVHRLDLVTSGLLLVARNHSAAAALSSLFEQHQIQKWYLAQSAHKPSKKQGLIKGDMQKARNGSWKLARTAHNPAITRFISQGHIHPDSPRHFLLAPQTGKTHQLRVALKSLGAPIDGDDRYGGKVSDRTYLHAFALQFDYQEEQYRFTCPPIDDGWQAIPQRWHQPWDLL